MSYSLLLAILTLALVDVNLVARGQADALSSFQTQMLTRSAG